MTVLYAYDQTDLTSYNLNFWYANIDREEFNDDANTGGWEDNYHIYTTTNDILSFYGSGFAREIGGNMTGGQIDALSQWAWVVDAGAPLGGYYTERWHWAGIDVSMMDFWAAGDTPSLADDRMLIRSILSGDDTFHLSDESDTIRGFQGNDIIHGRAGSDVLDGNLGDDHLFGGRGFDHLSGGRGNDTLLGRNGHDTLNGNEGDDTLRGGAMRDTITGGKGQDTFVFKTGDDKDIILDFDWKGQAHDVIDLRGLDSITGWNDLENNHMSQVGSGVRIDGGGGDVIRLAGVHMSDLDSSDFIF